MVGKTSRGWLQKGVDEYIGRIKHYLPLEVMILPDVKNSKNMNMATLKSQEGALILKNLTPADTVVLLDERGQSCSSVDFSQFVKKQMHVGTRRLVFVTGGAYGFSEEVYARGSFKLSLSLMTFSHQMVRLIFAEQFYRAMTILKGEPYHHG